MNLTWQKNVNSLLKTAQNVITTKQTNKRIESFETEEFLTNYKYIKDIDHTASGNSLGHSK